MGGVGGRVVSLFVSFCHQFVDYHVFFHLNAIKIILKYIKKHIIYNYQDSVLLAKRPLSAAGTEGK